MASRLAPYLKFATGVSRACLVVALVGLCFAVPASARTRCSYSGPPDNVLTITADKGALTEIIRRGRRIVARELLERPATCVGGVPTVFNTDTIHVSVATDDDFVDLFLGGGPFAPGATPEAEGASEIEIEIQFALSGGLATVHGTRHADEFHWGPGPALTPGLNLNPRNARDMDVDVTARGGPDTFLDMEAGPGDDTVVPEPGASFPNSFVFADGEDGNDRLAALDNSESHMLGGDGDDVLTGGGLHDFMMGFGGNDRLSGGGGPDSVYGGAGRDLVDGGPGRELIDGERGMDRVLGGPGRDRIFSLDHLRETIGCGEGRDRVWPDRRDHLRGCEAIVRR
jgi:Ca2+-binding RTX toxin-like protein